MSSMESNLSIIDRLDESKRVAVAARVITLWTMRDIGEHLKDDNIVFHAPHSLNSSAKIAMLLAADSEFRKLRISCLEVDADSNAHIARTQMGFTSKTLTTGLGNKRVVTYPEFQAATYYLEDSDLALKLDTSLNISPLLERDGEAFREHYTTQAISHILTLKEDSDLREIVRNTTSDSEYWLEH